MAIAFDPAALPDDFFRDPYPTYAKLRERDPVHLNPDGSYFLTRYAHLEQVYRSPDASSDKTELFGRWFGESPLKEHHTTSLVFNDPPYHTRVRKLISESLRPPQVRAMQPGLVQLVDRLLDELESKGEFDMVWDYSSAIPLELICNMLRVPEPDRPPIRGWSVAILGALEVTLSDAERQRGNRSVQEFCEYLDGLIAERRAHPGDVKTDLLTRLILAEEDGERLSEKELLHNCIFLLNAGHETTGSLIANGIHELLTQPGAMRRLTEDWSLIRTAVEEMLRYQSPVQMGNRQLTADMTFDDTQLPAGTQLFLCIGAANRDPRQFPDPDRFDIARQPNPHLAFITGAHTCLGNMMGRMEARIAIERLLRRFPALRLVGEPVQERRARFRRFELLPLSI